MRLRTRFNPITGGIIALALTLVAGAANAGCSDAVVSLRGDWGKADFAVEVADDDRERAKGLMYRGQLGRFAGMLFVYPNAQHVQFWMKNTLIPLDMIFAGPDGVVKSVHSMAEPGNLTAIDGGTGILVVLEVNGGLAAKLGIGIGSEMRHPSLGPGASWPCL